jgi:hypothetical protein
LEEEALLVAELTLSHVGHHSLLLKNGKITLRKLTLIGKGLKTVTESGGWAANDSICEPRHANDRATLRPQALAF